MKSQDRKNFWYQHIEAQKLSRDSAVMYCAREKISVYSFYHWRRKLEAPKRSALATVVTPFAAVEIVNNPTAKPARSDNGERQLPDPKWTAAFVSHLLREFTS